MTAVLTEFLQMIVNLQPGSIMRQFLSNKMKLLESEYKNKVKAFLEERPLICNPASASRCR